MMAKEPKGEPVHVDILAIDMQTGVHWLHPAQKDSDKAKAIREKHRAKHRDKYLAERKAARDGKAPKD